MISIARGAAASPALRDRRIRFFYGGRAARDVAGEAMLAALPGFGERITYSAAVSDDDPAWSGPRGFIHDAVRDAVPDLAAHEIYFAGPAVMAAAMQAMLHGAGVPPAQVHFDEFY
jgi:toluene monooxygenase electron transfer component